MYLVYVCVYLYIYVYQCIIELDYLFAFVIQGDERYYIKTKSLTILCFCSFCMLFKICLSVKVDIRIYYFVLQGIYFALLA